MVLPASLASLIQHGVKEDLLLRVGRLHAETLNHMSFREGSLPLLAKDLRVVMILPVLKIWLILFCMLSVWVFRHREEINVFSIQGAHFLFGF